VRQHDLGGGWKVESYYADSRGTHLPVVREVERTSAPVPLPPRASATRRRVVPQPVGGQSVQGLLPGTTLNGATTTRAQLLRAYPQVSGRREQNGAVAGTGTISVGTEEYRGSDHYQAGTILIEKRFTGHNSLTASLHPVARDRPHQLPQSGRRHPGEPRLSNDRRIATLGGIVDLPFGHGQKYGSGWNALTDAVLGGWTVSATYQCRTAPADLNTNLYYDRNRDPRDLHSNIGAPVPTAARPVSIARRGILRLLRSRRHGAHRHAHPARQQRPLFPVDPAELRTRI